MAGLKFTSPPEEKYNYLVGEFVEVMCDHDNDKNDRVRGWLRGIVVQVDPKIVAVQFEENVYLTNGWMVPDHVLWFPKDSADMRPARKEKRRPRNE